MLTSIKSVGSYVPSGILTNADLEKMVETSDTWIRGRPGIHERRIAAVDETATDLAAAAAKDALAAAGLRPQDTDLIVVSTSTPDSMFPSVASRVPERPAAAAGLPPRGAGLIVVSTSAPDSMFPSVASRVEERLGAQGPAFDVQAA